MTDFKNSFAVTLSSFTTVTLGPPTIVTFNLRKPSRTLDAIFNTEGFRIHIMSGTRWGKSIASTMVESQHGDALSRVRLELELDPQSAPHSNIENKPLQSSKHSEGESSNIHLVPLITGPGILAQMECKVTKSIDIGDHTVLFAEVLDLTETMAQDQKTGANHLPNHDRVALLYYEGDYAAAEKHEHSRVLA
jgi:flavin reductase (DIM6/NTAB) family NADH-FMN oxidoreductase RutF